MASSAKKITLDQTIAFAELSGDYNPVHLQPNYARRSLFGDSVIHGIHLLFSSLDDFLYRYDKKNISIQSLNVNFHNPAFHNSSLIFYYAKNINNDLHVIIRDDANQLIAEYKMSYSSEVNIQDSASQFKLNTKCLAKEKINVIETISQIKLDEKFSLLLQYDFDALKNQFPYLYENFNSIQIAELLTYTKHIGMHCPGLNSLFSGLSVVTKKESIDHVFFKIKDLLPRFSMVNFETQGPTLSGTLKSFFRPSSQEQNTMEEICQKVLPNEFIHQKALIIGGSRGIGEAVAKIFAAGKGIPTVTYNSGEDEANNLIQDIQKFGGMANQVFFNILNPQFKDLLKHGPFTHLFYFASPSIFVKSGGKFSDDLLQKFQDFYVTGFENLIDGLIPENQNTTIFYPSTVAIDEKQPALEEYCQAKINGESLCAKLNIARHLKIRVDRLPRIATDQTLTLTNYPAANAVDIMLPIIRKHSSS